MSGEQDVLLSARYAGIASPDDLDCERLTVPIPRQNSLYAKTTYALLPSNVIHSTVSFT